MKKENLSNKLFCKCNGHSKLMFWEWFGVKHSFCVPQPWMDPNANGQCCGEFFMECNMSKTLNMFLVIFRKYAWSSKCKCD
jgi:hypothetical protein